jgi:hypothetical protein
MIKRLVSLLALIILMVGLTKAQHTQPEGVIAQSWRRGNDTVFNQTIRIQLNPKQSDYATEVLGASGEKFRLDVVHNPLPSVKTEHWKIKLREILTMRKGKEAFSYDLLQLEPPDPNKHDFPREDLASYLYPEKEPPIIWVREIPFIEGFAFYPIKTIRKIRVAGFCLIAKVEDYQFSSIDKNRLNFLNLVIEFQNTCQ